MKMSIEFDEKKQQPRVVLEGEDSDECDQLRQIVSFKEVTFAVVVDDDDEAVEKAMEQQ